MTVNNISITSMSLTTNDSDLISIPDNLKYQNNILQLMCGDEPIGNSITITQSNEGSSSEGGSTSNENEWTLLGDITTTEEIDLIGVDNVNVTQFKIYLFTPIHEKDNYGYIQINGIDSVFMTAMVNNYSNVQSFIFDDINTNYIERKKIGDNWSNATLQSCEKWWTEDIITSIKVKIYSGDTFDIGTRVLIYGR